MNRNRKLIMQLFAAPENMTGTAQIQTKAMEIDFVSQFADSLQAFLDILGITRMIEKSNGSELRVKKVTGTLESGDVAEGEEIPLSKYQVEEHTIGNIRIEKFRKAVSIEAIADKGYEAAVEDTDKKMKKDLRAKIVNRFYDQLKAGSLTGNAETFQAAVAKAIGAVKSKFESMDEEAGEIAVWVNTEDFYDYLGASDITVQTAFGQTYIQNFLGADVMFLSSKISRNTVVSTPLNNIIAYYINVGNPEFKKAGLDYTVDASLRFVGFNVKGMYERAISDMNAIMGLRIMCEYQDAISNIAIGGSPTQTLGTLTLTSVKGSEDGKTIATVSPQLSSPNNVYKYKTNVGSGTEVTYGMDVKTWTRWDGISEIVAENGNYLTIVEADQNYKAVAKGDIVVVSE